MPDLPPQPRLDGPPSAKKPPGCGSVAALGCGGIVVLVIAVIGIASLAGSSDEPDQADAVTKYTQTWTESYSETTCQDWNSAMTAQQKFAASADILASARNKLDGGTGLPADALIEEFASGITNVCIIPTMTLTDATYGLYMTEPRFRP